jgi:hypothetical protein
MKENQTDAERGYVTARSEFHLRSQGGTTDVARFIPSTIYFVEPALLLFVVLSCHAARRLASLTDHTSPA